VPIDRIHSKIEPGRGKEKLRESKRKLNSAFTSTTEEDNVKVKDNMEYLYLVLNANANA
jgi:hypothetical protein